MGIREKLNHHPSIGLGLVVIAAAVASFVIYRSIRASHPNRETLQFYTVDDGKSWFVDDADKIPPFEKDGKMAVKAMLFECAGAGEPFVGYLERYNDSAHKQMVDLKEKAKSSKQDLLNNIGTIQGLMLNGIERKRPGDKAWVQGNVEVKCPDGSSAGLARVIAD